MFSCLLLTTLLATAASDTTVTREQRLEEVVVSSNTAERRISNAQIGAEQIQLKELKNTPALLGENDIMRSLQLLPGVKMESDASSGFQVRGGTSAQNAVLYDDAPVYNHIIFANQKHLLAGDYLIDRQPYDNFMGTTIELGSDSFKTWEEVITYFDRMGGQ